MLHYYRFRNFQSFADWTEVDLTLKPQSPRRGWERESLDGERRVSTALAAFGANGAGKTALLKPIAFLHWFVSDSFSVSPSSAIPVPQSLLDPDSPTELEVEFEDSEGVIWKYELAVNTERVVREALYRKQVKFAYVFKRVWNEEETSYDVLQQGFGFAPAEAKKVRQNASLISTAAQYGVEAATKLASLSMRYNVNFTGRTHFSQDNVAYAANEFYENSDLRNAAVELLARWDLGISDISLRQVEQVDSKTKEKNIEIAADVTHVLDNGRSFVLPLHLESSGTQSSFVLLALILPVLAEGGLAVIDELESDLHPDLVEPIMALFDNEITNPHRAQIIFTSHTTKVLDFLSKAQVMFVEKRDCVSSAFRGDSVRGLRVDDNLRSKYETGSLGAVPEVS